MTAMEQQIAEIMIQSKEEWAENNTMMRFGSNNLMTAFNFEKVDMNETAQIYDACKKCEKSKGLWAKHLAK